MKVSFFGSLSLLLLLPTLSYAALEHDLQSLQQHLAVLEGTLKASGDGGVQPVTVVMGKVWQENSKIVIDTAKALYDNIQLQTPDRRYVMHDTMYNYAHGKSNMSEQQMKNYLTQKTKLLNEGYEKIKAALEQLLKSDEESPENLNMIYVAGNLVFEVSGNAGYMKALAEDSKSYLSLKEYKQLWAILEKMQKDLLPLFNNLYPMYRPRYEAIRDQKEHKTWRDNVAIINNSSKGFSAVIQEMMRIIDAYKGMQPTVQNKPMNMLEYLSYVQKAFASHYTQLKSALEQLNNAYRRAVENTEDVYKHLKEVQVQTTIFQKWLSDNETVFKAKNMHKEQARFNGIIKMTKDFNQEFNELIDTFSNRFIKQKEEK